MNYNKDFDDITRPQKNNLEDIPGTVIAIKVERRINLF